MKNITYAEAINEAFCQLLETDKDVFVLGQGLWSPWYVGNTMTDLDKKFGKDRILDTPISENAATGVAIGAAMSGKRPIIVHPRMDFMLLAMDPLINQAANWSYLFEGQVSVPLVIRAIINRGGEQGAQHSQALQSFFMHTPGIKVVMPATAEDAKGLLIAAVYDNNPVMFIDDKWCYNYKSDVSDNMEIVPIGKAKIEREGCDITIVAISYMVHEALKCADYFAKQGIKIEVINLRTIKPWDKETVIKSVRKTKKVVIADTGWVEGGVSAEISSIISKECFKELSCPVLRVGLPNTPAPCARTLEEVYYPNEKTLINAVNKCFENQDDSQCMTKQSPGLIV